MSRKPGFTDSIGRAEAAAGVAAQLRRVVRGSVSDDLRRRAEYSSDAGNYRVLPSVVVEPLTTDDVLATLDICRASGMPVISRGGGTSIAGNSIGTGVIIDFSRHLNRILAIDETAQTVAAVLAAQVAIAVAGAANVDTDMVPIMAAEDFAYMLEARPGAFIFIGNGDSAGLHHPAYNFNDDALVFGTSYWVKLVETTLAA